MMLLLRSVAIVIITKFFFGGGRGWGWGWGWEGRGGRVCAVDLPGRLYAVTYGVIGDAVTLRGMYIPVERTVVTYDSSRKHVPFAWLGLADGIVCDDRERVRGFFQRRLANQPPSRTDRYWYSDWMPHFRCQRLLLQRQYSVC